MQPPPAPAPWQALAELKDGLLPTGELPPLVLRQSDSARVTPEPVPASKLPVPPSTAMAPSPTPATDVAVSNSLASTLRGFLSLCAPRLATLALLACLVPAIVFASPAGTRPSRYDLVAQTLQARLGRVPSPTLVRGVMNALPIPTGDLDTSFDTDGKQTVSFGGTDQAQAIGVDGSGRIVVAGYTSAGATGYDIAVARLTSSGALDATFAGDGTLTIHVTGDDYAYALAFDGDGNIIVVGSTQDNVGAGFPDGFAVARVTPDGELDESFSGDGLQTVTIFGQDAAYGVAVQDDGKIVVVGTGYNGGHRDFVVARFETDGDLDSGFSGDGKFNDGVNGGANDWGQAVAIQDDGKIVVAGASNVATRDLSVMRLEDDGDLDTSFDTDGKQTVDFGGTDEAFALALDVSGNIILAGYTTSGVTSLDITVARLTSSGALDATFSGDGKQTVDFGGADVANALALDGSGRIILVGGSASNMAVARLESDGDLDAEFSSDGLATVDFSGSDGAEAAVLESDGDVLVAGYTSAGAGATVDFAVARLTGTPPPPSTPTLTSPADGAIGLSRTPTFSWSDGGTGVTYDLLLESSDGLTTVLSKTGLATTSYTLNGTDAAGPNDELLDYSTSYQWRVRATNVSGTSSFASSRTFTVGPATPVPTAPVNNATGQSLTPTLDWGAVTGAGSYAILIIPGNADPSFVRYSNTDSYTVVAGDGLDYSTSYQWKVKALTGPDGTGADGAYSDLFTFTTLTPPSAPTLTAPADGATAQSIAPTLDWDAPVTGDAPASYAVEVRVGNASGAHVTGSPFSVTAPTTQLAVSGLTPGQTYYWSVAGVNAAGTGTAASRTFTTLPLPVVTTAAATSITSSTVTLNGTVNPGGGATTYVYRYGTDAELDAGTEVTTTVASAGSSTSAVSAPANVTGLASGTTYYFQIVATNASGTSIGSILSFITDVAPATGLAPTGTVSLEPTLDWNDVTGATAYTVTLDNDNNLGVDGADTTPPMTISAGATSTYAILNPAVVLANATTYYWQVTATGANGVPVTSAPSSFTTASATIVPAINYPSSGVTASPTNLRFSWSPGTRASRYTYRVQVDQSPPDWTSLAVNVGPLAESPHTVASLLEATSFAWRVVTYDANLDDVTPLAGTTLSFTTPVTFTTSGAMAAPVPILSYPTSNATVYTATATLSWYLNESVTGLTYDVRYRNTTDGASYPGAAGTTADAGFVTGLSALQVTTPALTPGKSYAWSARSCRTSTGLCSAWSSDATFTMNAAAGGAGTPTAPTLSYPTGGITVYGSPIRLSWTSAGSGLTYVVYTFECATANCADAPAIDNANTGYTASAEQSTRRYDFSVTTGKSYAWYVRSRNSSGVFSAASASTSFVVFTSAGTTTVVPSYPTGGATVYTLTPTLSWYLSGSAVGITGYEVCFGTAATAAGNPSCAAPASVSGVSNTSYVIPGGQLSYGTTYYWFVRTAGGSTWASASFVTTGSTGTAVPVASWPTGGATVWAASQSLSWYLTGSAAGITSYEGELTRVGGATTPFTVAAPTRSYNATGLVGGASYSWKVRSCAGATCSAYSTVATFTVHSSVGGGGAPMPFAESPALGVVLTGASKPVLSWSLPVEGLSALTYDVEVARTADMASPQRIERIASPQVVLSTLPAGTHYWRVRSRDAQGRLSDYSPVETFVTMTSVAVEEEVAIPSEYALEAVYPNPMERTGTVRFALPEASRVRLVLYDALGREAVRLVDGELPAGVHRITLEASALPSGLYVARLRAGSFTAIRTLVISH